jgi:hypothetical protein
MIPSKSYGEAASREVHDERFAVAGGHEGAELRPGQADALGVYHRVEVELFGTELAVDKVLVEVSIIGVLLTSAWRITATVHRRAAPRTERSRTKDSGV